MEYVFRPLRWPMAHPRTPPGQRATNVFKADWKDTMQKLDHEMAKLGASQVVIQLDLKESDFRVDGRPREDRSPATPAVVIAFTGKDVGALQLPCDRFQSWRYNVRAIAYHLEHLRMSALYGVGARGEQYRGWKALPDARLLTPAMSVDEAADAILELSGETGLTRYAVTEGAGTYRELYRRAAKKHHSDKGGDAVKWQQLQEAKRVLDAHHGGQGAID